MAERKTALRVFALMLMIETSACFIATSSQKPLKVASFNIRHFGRGVMSNATVAGRIAEICSRYDVVLIMETRDKTGTALNDLWTLLNKTDDWGLVQSIPIGRSLTYKEQYVYYYRTEKAKLLSSYLVPDVGDVYEREPFCLELQFWSVSRVEKRRVALLGLHAKPSDVKSELNQLPDTIKSVANHFHAADGVVAMGDFNADCRYASAETLGGLEIFNSSSDFKSLIPSSADTSVSGHTDCAYDRLVIYGSSVLAQDAQVYNFQTDLNLGFYEAYDISDHYPVEFQLY